MRVFWVSSILMGSCLASASLSAGEMHYQGAAQARAASEDSARQADMMLKRRVSAMQHQLDRQQQILKQRLAAAARLRQVALEKSDQQMLKRAEQLEREAFTQYQRQVEQLEKSKITPSTQVPSAKPYSAAPAPRSRTAPNETERSRTRRSPRWFWLFGRD